MNTYELLTVAIMLITLIVAIITLVVTILLDYIKSTKK